MESIAAVFVGITLIICIFAIIGSKDINKKLCNGYFLAERSLSGILIAFSFILTNLSVEILVGTAGLSYSSSMSLMGWEISSAVGLIILAFVFLPRYFKMGITTMPEFFSKRYDESLGRFIAVIFIAVYIFVVMPTVLLTGATFVEKILGLGEILKISHFASIKLICILTAVITSIYCFFGNLKTAAKADAIYGSLLLLGGLALSFLGIRYLGKGDIVSGFNHFLTASPEKLNAFRTPKKIPYGVLFFSLILHNLFYWCTNQVFIQRFFAAKSLKEAQKGAVFSSIFKLFGVVYLIIPGIIAFQINPALQSFDSVFPMLIGTVVPRYALGLVGAILFGVTISAFNRVLHSTASMLVLDIYKPLFNKEAEDTHLVNISKRIILLLAVASACSIPIFISIKGNMESYLNLIIGYINMPILATVIIGILSRKASALSAKLTFLFHFLCYTTFLLIPIKMPYFIVQTAIFVMDIMFMLIISFLIPRKSKYAVCDSEATSCEAWKHTGTFSVIILILGVLLYCVFSPLVLAK